MRFFIIGCIILRMKEWTASQDRYAEVPVIQAVSETDRSRPQGGVLAPTVRGQKPEWDGFYVYSLINLLTDWPFYVGKGIHARVFTHFYNTRCGRNNHCNATIKRIWQDGGSVGIKVLFITPYEAEAFDAEQEIITYYGRRCDGTGILTNRAIGGRGCSGAQLTPNTNVDPLYGQRYKLRAEAAKATVMAWRDSGEEMTAWCRKQGIATSSFCRWRRTHLPDYEPAMDGLARIRRETMTDWAGSGLSIPEYARKRGFCKEQLYMWRAEIYGVGAFPKAKPVKPDLELRARRHLEMHRQSGLSAQAYCRQNHISKNTLREWRQRFPFNGDNHEGQNACQ